MSAPNKRRYFKELRLQQFRALTEVARKGTFTAAAQALGLSRTSVWQQIRSLEDDFGVELAVVRGHHLTLTPEGMLLLQMIEPIVDGFDGVKAAFHDRLGILKRRLVVATTASLLSYELRAAVEIYRKEHPEVSISLVDRPSKAGLDLLLHGEADVAVIGRVDEMQGRITTTRHLTDYPFFLAFPKKHELARSKTVKITDLVRYPLILPSQGTNARDRIDAVLEKSGIAGTIQLALDSNNARLLLSYVEQGLGVALTSMSPILAKNFSEHLALRDVCDLFGKEEVLIVQRQQRYPLPHVNDFINTVVKSLS
jgi:molybdate transport repressor ModE-like protein